MTDFRLRVSHYWTAMQNNSLTEGLYINDFHRNNSTAAQREVARMSLHSYSREQKIRQIMLLNESKTTKESANEARRKLR